MLQVHINTKVIICKFPFTNTNIIAEYKVVGTSSTLITPVLIVSEDSEDALSGSLMF